MAYKQKPITFGEGTGNDKFLKDQNESKVKSTDYLEKTPSIVASNAVKEDYNKGDGSNDSEEDNNKETKRINTTPNTRPPLFSDDAHSKVKKKGVPCKKCGCNKCGK
jgi:hypothetical protein